MVFLFSPAGAWTATQRLANTFEIGSNPDELTGTTEANFFDTNGNLTATVCATVIGRRLDSVTQRKKSRPATRDDFVEALRCQRNRARRGCFDRRHEPNLDSLMPVPLAPVAAPRPERLEDTKRSVTDGELRAPQRGSPGRAVNAGSAALPVLTMYSQLPVLRT